MRTLSRATATLACATLVCVAACGGDAPTAVRHTPTSCPGIDFGATPPALSLPVTAPATMQLLGGGLDTVRYSAEIAVRGATA